MVLIVITGFRKQTWHEVFGNKREEEYWSRKSISRFDGGYIG